MDELLQGVQGLLEDPFFQTYGGIVVRLLLIVALALAALRLTRLAVAGAVRALFDREAAEGTSQDVSALEIQKRRATLSSLGAGIARGFVLIVAFLMGMNVIGLDVGPAIAGLGIAGLALGLGAQNLVRDYIAGAFILVENQYANGDIVRIVDVTGTVEDFTLRRTTLRDFDGTVHTVPNGLIGVSSNLTRIWARIDVDVTVSAADVEKASRLIDEAGRAMAADPAWASRMLEVPHVERLTALTAAGATLKVFGSVRADDRWNAASDLRRRILAAFAQNEVSVSG